MNMADTNYAELKAISDLHGTQQGNVIEGVTPVGDAVRAVRNNAGLDAQLDEPLFDRLSDALCFAYRYAGQQFAKVQKIDPTPLGSGKGLSGLDGAGEAATILRLCNELPKIERAALRARFGVQVAECSCCGAEGPQEEWRGACKVLATEVAMKAAGTCHERLAHALVMRHFSFHSQPLEVIASRHGDGLDKVKKIAGKVKAALRKAEAEAQASISERLISIGMLGRC